MPTPNPFPLNIDEKQDTWSRLQLLSNIAPEFKLVADEFNKIVQALNYIYENLDGSPGTTPNFITISGLPFLLIKNKSIPNNSDSTLQVGDVIWGFLSDGSYVGMKYLGGDNTDFENENVYTIFTGI